MKQFAGCKLLDAVEIELGQIVQFYVAGKNMSFEGKKKDPGLTRTVVNTPFVTTFL